MKKARQVIPFLGIFTLALLFLKMPESPNLLSCKTCTSSDPYLPLIGAGYFASLVALSILFPTFPGPRFARGGLLWAVLLAFALTYIQWPLKCPICWIAHGCNILIWALWSFTQAAKSEPHTWVFRERLYLAFLAPLSAIALFSSLNLTFMAYGFKMNSPLSSFKLGDPVPAFAMKTAKGLTIANDASEIQILNFVAPDCPFCKEQIQILNAVASSLKGTKSCRIVHISPSLPSHLVQLSPEQEWVEDKDRQLRALFKVEGYPMMYVVNAEGKISQIVRGVPEELQSYLLENIGQ